jgi:Fe-S-cluster containining protein
MEGVDRCEERLVLAAEATEAFSDAHGLHCPTGCGACCLSPEVECSVAEWGPLVRELVRDGRAEAVLTQLHGQLASGSSVCVFYAAENEDPRRGRCQVYGLRPMICRLFGFSARRDRDGTPELVSCRVMREHDPAAVAAAAQAVRDGASAPVMGDLVGAVLADASGTDGRMLPINEALRVALERALLRASFEAAEATGEEPDDDGRPRPARPPRRPRAA